MDVLQFKISNEITIVKIVGSFLKFISLSRQYLVNRVRFQKYHGKIFFSVERIVLRLYAPTRYSSCLFVRMVHRSKGNTALSYCCWRLR